MLLKRKRQGQSFLHIHEETGTLVGCLKTLRKDALLRHAKRLDIKGVSTLSNADLAERIPRVAIVDTDWIGRLVEEPREGLRGELDRRGLVLHRTVRKLVSGRFCLMKGQ